MHSFEFTRPENTAATINVAGQAKTAQQGADIKFVAGTTLIDLMKLEVKHLCGCSTSIDFNSTRLRKFRQDL